MAIRRVEHVNLPYAGRRYTPDTTRLGALYSRLGDALADTSLRKGEITQRGMAQLADLFSGFVGQRRATEAAKAASATRQREREEDKAFSAEQNRLERQERENRELAQQAIRDKERASDAAIRKAEKEEAAVSDAIDKAPRGIASPALLDAAKKFPSQAARFVMQDGVSVLPMTGAEKQAYDREKAATADRKADNARLDEQFKELQRHNRATEANATTKAAAPEFYIRDGVVTPLQPNEIKSGDIPYSAAAMQGRGGESADARAMRTAAALNSIDTLKSLAPRRTEGPIGLIEGAIEKGKAYAGFNSDVRQYEALLQPTAMQMAVAIQGAAGLSNAEREVMVGMLGNISTMDYKTQMALLEKASELVRGGADVTFGEMPDPKTGQVIKRWMPVRSRMPGGFTANQKDLVLPAQGGFIVAVDPQGNIHHAPAGTALPAGWKLKQ